MPKTIPKIPSQMPQTLLKPNDGVTVPTNLYTVEETDENVW